MAGRGAQRRQCSQEYSGPWPTGATDDDHPALPGLRLPLLSHAGDGCYAGRRRRIDLVRPVPLPALGRGLIARTRGAREDGQEGPRCEGC